ncbi:MAG TPA: AMP-binding protein [Dehalococcoidia bacterium]|nr:AMP-binding protein [Dehalococcoidia bacterium]
MVLGKLRILGAPSDDPPEEAAVAPDGSPLTFPLHLETCRRTWGDKTAFQQKVRGRWERLSHVDVYKRSYDLAAGLVALGLRPGERVALIAENSIDWACCYYAIVVAGGVAVPIYYDLKPQEIAEMVERAEATMAIASAKVLGRLQDADTRVRTAVVIDGPAARAAVPGGLLRRARPEVVPLGDVAGRATAESRERLGRTAVEPDDLASIVFTSGTTGGMKGVTLTHRNFMANLRQVRQSISFGERDRLVMVLPMHHAFPFIVSMAVAPAVGGEVTFENDLRRIRDRMAEVKPTLFLGVPALFELMYRNIVHSIEAQGRRESFERGLRIVEATKQRTGINLGRIVFRELHKRLGGSLRFMVSGGAALSPSVAQHFARLGVPILQGWGLTEASPVLAVQRWNPRKFYMSNYYEEHIGTVGQAIEGVEIGLIDVPEKELYVHLHGEGELVARGDNITPGYWKSEEATRVQKVGDWLRTGDVGCIDDEGNIWITGRSKFVIVLDSGEKIHPDEIEAKLGRSALIEDVVVAGHKARGKTQARAVVYPHRDAVLERLAGAPVTEESVHALIAAEIDAQEADIAAYKRTSDVVLTDVPLPKTVLRKIARGLIAESYSFNLERWARSWEELQAAQVVPPADPEDEDGGAVA